MALLETRNLIKNFGANRAVDGVNFVIDEGELVALIGSNGAGKTTLVNLISAFLEPDEGEILFKGENINAWPAKRRIAAGIARSFQLVSLFDELSARDNVSLSIFRRENKIGRMMSLADNDHAVHDEAESVLARFGLSGKGDIKAGLLAHGERKLLDVAVAFALSPSLLFLDEPTSGVNTRDKSQIMDTISSVVRGGNMTAVIIEHDMDVVFTYSNRIVAMHHGVILADGAPNDIRNNPEVVKHMLGGVTEG